MSYELIDKKENKEERLELSLFLPLDGSFFYFQNKKNIDCRRPWGGLDSLHLFLLSLFASNTLFFVRKRIIIISTTLADSYLISHPSRFFFFL